MVFVIDAQVAGISGDMLLSSLVNIGANKSKIIDGIHSAESLVKDVKVKKIDLIYSANTLSHIKDLGSVFRSIKNVFTRLTSDELTGEVKRQKR